MIGAADSALTLGGFVALATLGLAAIGLAVSSSARTAALRERIAKLEAVIEDHLRNGMRHEHKE